MPGIISLVDIRCLGTTLFPDLNLAGGRNYGTGSKPKADTSSPSKLMVLPNKESVYLIFTLGEGGGTPPAPPVLNIIFSPYKAD
jgi:hypothetical protein